MYRLLVSFKLSLWSQFNSCNSIVSRDHSKLSEKAGGLGVIDVKFPTTKGSLGKVFVGVIYPCKHCSYELPPKGKLKGHQKSVHEEFMYQTNIAALKQLWYEILKNTKNKCMKDSNVLVHIVHMKKNINGALAKHWKEAHESVKYPCKHCSYKAT